MSNRVSSLLIARPALMPYSRCWITKASAFSSTSLISSWLTPPMGGIIVSEIEVLMLMPFSKALLTSRGVVFTTFFTTPSIIEAITPCAGKILGRKEVASDCLDGEEGGIEDKREGVGILDEDEGEGCSDLFAGRERSSESAKSAWVGICSSGNLILIFIFFR